MLHFENDYLAGAHPAILKRFAETNFEALSGYGFDTYSDLAKKKIAAACGDETYQVEFLTGGTQTNVVVISTMLKDYESVISAKTGHLNGHEAGAMEYTGHKIYAIPSYEGKITSSDLRDFLVGFHSDSSKEHAPCPGMVYISYPTEYGTLYSKKELEDIGKVCREYELPLFIDGARLGYGLMSTSCDLTLPELAKLCDVFYIGGTKVGALCGEAVVFTKNNRPKHFLTSVKRRGALIAKGRLISVQFDTLFTDDLYFEISRHALRMADILKEMLTEKGYEFYIDSPTNQQFVVVDNQKLAEISEKVVVSVWEALDGDRSVIRLATSWSTTEEDLMALKDLL